MIPAPADNPADKPLWQPAPDVFQRAQIGAFMRAAAARHGIRAKNYAELHEWSVENRAEVWGRPAALAITRDGALLIADDTGGTIWRITYTGARPRAGAAE